MTTKHYVEFFYSGIITADTSCRPSDHRDPARVSLPDGAYAFHFFDREETELDGETLRGERKNVSPTYYPGGTVKTLAEIEALHDPRDRILLSNMRGNDWPAVVYTRFGNWPQPYREGREVVLPDTGAES